ncbi:MAG: multicopper oxidase domain-containing protein [Streptosporangiaceae bacterium]
MLSEAERRTLSNWARRRTTAQGLALRARIVLGCADGGPNIAVAARLGVSRATVAKWRARFLRGRLDGLSDEPRPGEYPRAGTVEDWVFVNMTGDTHPMHTHLFSHQVIGRVPFDAGAYQKAHGGPDGVPGGIDPAPFATGLMLPPTPDERGFKDTTKANPGYYTIVRARVDLPSGVRAPQTCVYHCHIVEHEDNDMMQSFIVLP